MAIELKLQYLEVFSTETKTLSAQHVHKVGACVLKGPMPISIAEDKYGIRDLSYCIQAYIHNCSYPKGDGNRHRVKRQNLPTLDNSQVFIFHNILDSVIHLSKGLIFVTYCRLSYLVP